MNYKELIQIKELYTNTEQETIKANIKRLMSDTGTKHAQIGKLLGISLHTSYSYTNAANKGKPDLYNLLILASYFNVTIKDILK